MKTVPTNGSCNRIEHAHSSVLPLFGPGAPRSDASGSPTGISSDGIKMMAGLSLPAPAGSIRPLASAAGKAARKHR